MMAALALGALSAGGSLLSGMGAKQASGKQARLQMIADAMAREANDKKLAEVNATRNEVGNRALTALEDHTRTETEERWENQRYDEYITTRTTEGESEESVATDDGWFDVDGFMAAAEASGFNPYTFAQLGGLAAYSNRVATSKRDLVRFSNTDQHTAREASVWSKVANTLAGGDPAAIVEAYKMMLPEYTLQQASQIPQQHSALSAFGGALTAGASAFGTQYRADQAYDLGQNKLDLAAQQMAMGLAGTNQLSRVLNSGAGGGGTITSNARTGTGQASGISALPYPDKWKYGEDVTVTNPHSRSNIDPTTPDAEVGEKRYGEPGEFFYGMRNMINDGVVNVTGRSPEEWGRAAGMNVGDFVQKGDKGWLPAFGRWWNSPITTPGKAQIRTNSSGAPYAPFAGAYPEWASP